MTEIHRMGDANTGGGVITAIPQSTVFVNGQLGSVDGAVGTSHPPCPDPSIHCAGNWVTANGSPSVFIEGIAVNRQGDGDTCGHARAAGSPDVFANEGGA